MVGSVLLAVLLAAQNQGRPPAEAPAPSPCAQGLSSGTTASVAELCLAEDQMRLARALGPDVPERFRRLAAAAEHYRRAAMLATDSNGRIAAYEALAMLYARDQLNEYDQLEAALRELIDLQPGELEPVFRLAKAQEDRGLVDTAEETLLGNRRLRPDAVEPYRMLAQFYARRATAVHTANTATSRQPASAPGEPDENGVYRVGGGITAPNRLDRPVYPPEAQAAGLEGVVIAEVVIDPSGDVVDAKVVRSIPMLDEAALNAVRNWHFAPTLVNGQPVAVRMTVTVNFTTK